MLKEEKFINKKSLITLSSTFALLGALVIILWKSQEITLYLVSVESVFLKKVFYITNFLGEPLFHIITGLLLLLLNVRKGMILSAILIINSLLVVTMKFIASQPRPYSVFSENNWLDQINIPGTITILTDDTSFPSYHSAGAFAMITFFILTTRRKFPVLLLFAAAILTAVGRVYFFQHFFIDIYFGALIGIAVSYACYAIFRKYYYDKLSRLDGPAWVVWKKRKEYDSPNQKPDH